MEKNFWLEKWQTNQIGFHLKEAHPYLVKYLDQLALKKGNRIFLPLCGKTLDIHWLLSQGHHVVGAELVEMAIIQLFDELGIEPQIQIMGKLKKYSAPHIEIFVGDIFEVNKDMLGEIHALYDRAALVALPKEVRIEYVKHLKNISSSVNELLITFEYDQSLFAGPPFSVDEKEVKNHYPSAKKLESKTIEMRGSLTAKECIWHIF